MANVKNFGLVGVGSTVQWAKGGSRIKTTGSAFNLRDAADGADVALTTAGITSSAGNVTLTTGNFVLSSNSGVLTVGDAGNLARAGTGVFQLTGTGAVIVPSGTAAQQPTAATYEGGFRYNQDTNTMEYSDGSAWQTLAFAGGSVASITGTANQITASSPTGAVTLSIPSTFIAPGSIASTTSISSGSTVSSTTSMTAGTTLTVTGNTANAFLYSGAAGLVASTAAATDGQLLIGRTGNTPIVGTITGGTGITVTNGAGTITVDVDPAEVVTTFSAGSTGLTPSSPTSGAITLAGTLSLANGGTNASLTAANGGIVYSTSTALAISSVGSLGQVLTSSGAGAPTWTTASSTVTTNEIVQGDGSGAFTANGATFVGSGSFSGVTLSGTVTNATDATTKAYVDAVASSLNVHEPVETLAASLTESSNQFDNAVYANGTLGVGATLTAGSSIPLGAISGYYLWAEPVGARLLVNCYVSSAAAGGATWTANGIYTVTTKGGTGSGAATLSGLTGGSGYDVDGTYVNVPLTGGAGSGAVANIVISGGSVTSVTLQYPGTGYAVSNALSASDANLGGRTGGSAFSINVATLDSAAAWVLTRATDANNSQPGQVKAGDFVFVTEGTFATTGWVESQVGTGINDAIIIGTDPIVFSQFSGAGTYTAGSGLTLSGTAFSVDVSGSNTVFVTGGNDVAVKSSATTNQVLLSNGSGNEAVWGAVPLGNSNAISGTLLAVNGGTGFASYTVGDILYADTTTTLAKRAVGASGTVLHGGTTPTYSAVSLTADVSGVLPVANGGTNVSSLAAAQVLYGGAGGTSVAQEAAFSYDASTNTLTVGDGTIDGGTGGDLTITATATNGDINLNPNGTGSVVVGPAATAGLIQSDSGQTLTVNGVAGLTLEAGTSGNVAITSAAGTVNVTSFTGDITMTLGTGGNVTVAGVTAAAYAGTLADADLVNKYYVDNLANEHGDVKAVQAVISLASTGSFDVGSALPAGVTILQVKVNVTAADTATGNLQVGKAGGSQYMTTSENDTQTTGIYIAEDDVNEATSITVQATVGGTPGGAGSATVIVTYQVN